MFTPPAFLSHRRAAVLQDVTEEAKSLISRADGVMQQVGIQELQPGDQQKKEVEDWLSKVEEIKRELLRIEKGVEDGISSSTNTIQDQVDRLRDDISKLMEMGGNDATAFLPLADSKLKGQRFEENLRWILSLLDCGVRRIGVYGVGGVGKTTLATHIHDELLRKQKSSVETVYWVTVSHGATVFDLQSKIAKAIQCHHILKLQDLKKRAGNLRQELSARKNSVLILDDVWKAIVLEEVGIPDGFKFLLTTRFRDVCLQMECKEIVKVGCLSDEESWELFREILGSTYDILPQEGKATVSLISKKCAGLPLGIKVVAASMRGVDDIHEWRNALAELTESTRHHQGLENEVLPLLKLSFDRLNDMLVQNCFLYCALYPEDYEFFKGWVDQIHHCFPEQRTTLIEAWIAEGFLEGLQSRQEQIDKGYVVLNKLLNACLLESVAGNEIMVKMHDLVREMAVKVGSECHGYMTKAGKYIQDSVLHELEWTEDLTKVSMMYCGIRAISPAVPPNCSNLTTLLLQENPIAHVSRDFFLLMKGLRVLDLSHTDIQKLPDSISDLENLVALLLRGCKQLEYVPSLGKLRKLKVLDLCYCYKLLSICSFKTVKGENLIMRKLRELLLGGGSDFGDAVEEMSGLASLEFLDWEGVRIPLTGMITTHSHLQVLRLDPRFESLKGVDLMQLVCLKKLVGYKFSEMDDFCCYVSSQHYLQLSHYEFWVTQTPLRLYARFPFNSCVSKSVELCGWKSEELIMLPRDVQRVVFDNCDFGMTRSMDRIPCLQGFAGETTEIHVLLCERMEFVLSAASSSSSPFPKLEMLELFRLDDLKGLVGGVLPTPPGSLKNLEMLSIQHCKGLAEVMGGWEEGDGANEDVSIEVGDRAIAIAQEEHNIHQYLPNLKTLVLWDLPELRSICGHHVGVLSSVSIESITIYKCPKLKKLPLSLPSLGDGQLCAPLRLREIIADRKWWDSLEWDSHEVKNILEQFLIDPYEI